MRRILLRLAIFALTFGLGVGVYVGWQLYQWSLTPYDGSTPFDVSNVVAVTKPHPTGLRIVSGMDACGPAANFHIAELSDGTRIDQSCRYMSANAIAREVKNQLANAEVAERSEERDENGRVTGEKILILSPKVIRLNISGNSLCQTEAATFTHLQLYEQGKLLYAAMDAGNE